MLIVLSMDYSLEEDYQSLTCDPSFPAPEVHLDKVDIVQTFLCYSSIQTILFPSCLHRYFNSIQYQLVAADSADLSLQKIFFYFYQHILNCFIVENCL